MKVDIDAGDNHSFVAIMAFPKKGCPFLISKTSQSAKYGVVESARDDRKMCIGIGCV